MREYPKTAPRKRKRRKANKGLIIFELFLLGLILLVVFKGDALFLLGKKMLKIEKLTLEPVIEIPYIGRNTLLQSSVFKANNQIVICEEAELKVYSLDGVLAYQGELNANSTFVKAGSTFYAVADRERGEVVTIDYKGTILNKLQNLGPLKDLEVLPDGSLLIQLQDKKTIQLYSQSLELLLTTTIPSGEILEARAFIQASTIAVAAVETAGNTLSTVIYQYGLDGKLLGITNLDSEIVYDLFADDKIRALTDTAFYSLTPDGVVLQKDSYEGLLHTYVSINGGLLLLTEALIEDILEDVKAYNFQTYDFKTYVLKSTPVSDDYTQLIMGESYLLAVSESTVDLFDSLFQMKASIPNDKGYTKGFWLSKTRVLLYNDLTADIYDVKH